MMSDKSKYRLKMLSMIGDWKQSGQNQKAYCKTHSIPYHQFHYWYKQYKLVPRPANELQPSFIEVHIPVAEIKSCAEVIYPDGKRSVFIKKKFKLLLLSKAGLLLGTILY